MRDDRLKVWFAPEDMRGGKKTHEQIDQAIRVHDKLLLVLSRFSMQSEWVKSEIYKALRREKEEKKRILFPIRLVSMEVLRKWEAFDSDTGRDMAREVREYHIPDFRRWKDHDQFEENYRSLIKDLRL